MLKEILSNKRKVSKVATFLSTFILVSSFMSTKSDAARYYIRSVFDEGSFGIISQVVSDNSSSISETLERKGGYNFSSILDYRKVHKGGGDNSKPGSSLIANICIPTASYLTEQEKAEELKTAYDELTTGDENKGLLFTFPGLSNEGSEVTYVGTSADAARAELVGNTLTKGINDALAFVKTYSGTQHIGGEGLRHIVAQLSRITSQFPDKTEISFNTGNSAGGKDFYLQYINTNGTTKPKGSSARAKDELIPVNGLDYSDYVIVSTKTKEDGWVYSYFPWRMEKGYYPGGAMSKYVGAEYSSIAKGGNGATYKENKYITWGQLAMQAGVNADLRGTSSSDSAEDTMTLIGQGLGADLTSTINSVRSLLNLAPIQELILNMGSRNVTHHLGVMTEDMYETAKTVYTLILAVSLLALGALIVKMIHQKMVSTTNIIAKTSLMEGLQDIMFVGIMLALFPSIFELMLELNYGIVKTFSYSHNYLQAYGISGAKVLGLETLAGFIVSSMFLSIDAYINVTYLVRAIVVSFLFAISPIMTISYAWGPVQKKLYFSYIRELVGNIFMQSFHAITMTFFAGYNTTNMSSMEAIASTYCFIPITQLFRSLVIGSQGGFSEQLGGKLAGQLTNTATGMHKSSIAMKQAKAMSDTSADNAKLLANASFKSQMLGVAGDAVGQGLNAVSGELGHKFAAGQKMAGKDGALSKGGGAAGKILGTVGQGVVGGLGAYAGANAVTKANEQANQNLGKLQMEHSMENIGVGLAQAGIGMGISSYDASGGGMVSAGMSSVEKASGDYARGQALTGEAGKTLAQAKGIETGAMLGAQSLRNTVRDGGKALNNHYADKQKQRDKDVQVENNFNSLGIERKDDAKANKYVETANAIGLKSTDNNGRFTEKTSPIVNMQKVDENTVAVTLDANKVDNVAEGNAIFDYLQAYKANNGSMNTPELKALAEKAERAGMNMSNGTGILAGDINSGNFVIAVNDAAKNLGVTLDAKGNTVNATHSIGMANGSLGSKNSNTSTK